MANNKMVVTFADGRVLHALAPMGLRGVLATVGWDGAHAAAERGDAGIPTVQKLLLRSDALAQLRRIKLD